MALGSHPAWHHTPPDDAISAVHHGQRSEELGGGKGKERQGKGEDRM